MRAHPLSVLLILTGLLTSGPVNSQWKQTNGPGGGTATCFFQLGPRFFAGTTSSIYESTDSGASWHDRSSGLQGQPLISAFAFAHGMLYAAATNVFFRSSDSGATWTRASALGLPKKSAGYLFGACTHSLIAIDNENVFRSSDGGDHWQRLDSNLMNLVQPSTVLTVGDTTYMAGLWIISSTDDGRSWAVAATPPADSAWQITSMASFDSVILAYNFLRGMMRSTDNGRTWSRSTGGIQNFSYYSVGIVRVTSTLFFGKWDQIYRSSDLGHSWQPVPQIPLLSQYPEAQIGAIGAIGNTLFASYTGAPIVRSIDTAKHWSVAVTGINASSVHALTPCGDTLLAGTNGGLSISTDRGDHWIPSESLPPYNIASLFVNGDRWYAGFEKKITPKVSYSSDRGTHWTAVDTPALVSVNALLEEGTTLFAGGISDGKYSLFNSTNNGARWAVSNINPRFMTVHQLLAKGSNLIAATTLGLYFSNDGGARWWEDGTFGTNDVSAIGATDSLLFCCFALNTGKPGIYSSTDDGVNWTHADSLFPLKGHVTAFASSGNSVFAATDSLGIYLTTDRGHHWDDVGDDLRDANIQSLLVHGTDLIAGTASSGVWRRPLAEMLGGSSVQRATETKNEVQLYPNPSLGTVTVECPTGSVNVQVISNAGRAVWAKRLISNGTLKLDLAGVPNGSYQLELSSATTHRCVKFALER